MHVFYFFVVLFFNESMIVLKKKRVFIVAGTYAVGIILLGYYATHKHFWVFTIGRTNFVINMSYWTYVTVLVLLVFWGLYFAKDYLS